MIRAIWTSRVFKQNDVKWSIVNFNLYRTEPNSDVIDYGNEPDKWNSNGNVWIPDESGVEYFSLFRDESNKNLIGEKVESNSLNAMYCTYNKCYSLIKPINWFNDNLNLLLFDKNFIFSGKLILIQRK